jgi:hypothetical protein
MKAKISVIGLMATSIIASSAMAFDGQRQGSVLGGAIGFAPVASWSGDPVPSYVIGDL